MIQPGDIISYLEMCTNEGVNLQRGMNYHLRRDTNVILMRIRPNAPYVDNIEGDGQILSYEGNNIPKSSANPIPKIVDQSMIYPSGSSTQNGLFYDATLRYKNRRDEPELVRVYEKLHRGIWVFNGIFKLVDAWQEENNSRKVFSYYVLGIILLNEIR